MKFIRLQIFLATIAALTRCERGLTWFAKSVQGFASGLFRLRDRCIKASDAEWARYAARQPRLWCIVGGKRFSDAYEAFSVVQKRYGYPIRTIITPGGSQRYFVGLKCVAEVVPDPLWDENPKRSEHTRIVFFSENTR